MAQHGWLWLWDASGTLLGVLSSTTACMPGSSLTCSCCLVAMRCCCFTRPCLLLAALCNEGRHETAWQLIRRLSASNNRLPLKVLHRLLKTAGQVRREAQQH